MQSKKRIIRGSGKTPKSLRQRTQGNKKEINNLARSLGTTSLGTNKRNALKQTNGKKHWYYGKSAAPAWSPSSMTAAKKKTKKPHWANSLKKTTGKKTKRSTGAFGKKRKHQPKPRKNKATAEVNNLAGMFGDL